MKHAISPVSSTAARAAGSHLRIQPAIATLAVGCGILRLAATAALAVSVSGAAAAAAAAEEWTPPDTFTATTAEMEPAELGLKIDVKEWSDDEARAAVLAAMGDEDASALTELPTVGYVWVSGSGVGYALKYAHRSSTAEGERITFVTDRAVGSYDFKPWMPKDEAAANDLAYSVIELDLDESGNGDGTMSLAADVAVDADAQTVSLDPDAPRLLVGAKAEPKPYWARQQSD